MLTPEEAAALANVNARQIYAWVEAGQLHHTETEQGELLVCLKQLLS
jgi:excisionase family DNA binding protein